MIIPKKYININNLQITTFVLYFVFNFIARDIGNIFLLLTLFLCLINYQSLYKVFMVNAKLVTAIVLFTIYISVMAYYHSSPLNELDNYFRLLLLLPLLSIAFSDRVMIRLLYICALVGLIHWLFNHVFVDNEIRRYAGTSSSIITFSNMCATLSMLSLYYALYKTENSYSLLLSAIVYMFLYIETETRGPFIGIIIVIIYFAFIATRKFKNRKYIMLPFLILSIITLAIMTTHHPLAERIKSISKINLIDPMKTHDESLRERIFYIKYSMEEVNENPITGVGPQNIKSRMSQKIKEQKLIRITPRDHVHNEFFDIVLKFGFMSLILLFQIYFFILNNKNKENHILINVLMIMFISSQLVQSQFSHHQAITFFLGLLYVLQPKTRSQLKVEKITTNI